MAKISADNCPYLIERVPFWNEKEWYRGLPFVSLYETKGFLFSSKNNKEEAL